MPVKRKALNLVLLFTIVLLKAHAQQPELVVQKGNADSINCIQYSPDGKSFLTVCSAESTVKIWEAASGRLLKTIAATAKGASYSEDGSRILLEETNQFSVYDALNDSLLFYVNRGAENFPVVSFANKGLWLVAAGVDAAIDIKHSADNILIQKINTKHSKVLSAQLSPDNKHLITFSEDSTVSMINITNDSTLYEFHFPGFIVQNFAFSKTGKYAVIKMISPYYYEVEKNVLAEVATGKQINYEGKIFDILPDEKFLLAERPLSGMNMGATSVYEREIFNDTAFLEIPFSNFSGLNLRAAYSKDGNFFLVWNQFFVSAFNSSNLERTATYHGDSVDNFVSDHEDLLNPDNPPVISVSFNADGKKILIGLATGRIKEMSTLAGSNNIHEIENPFNAIVDAQYIPAHATVFTKAADNLGIAWNIENATVQYSNDLTYFSLDSSYNDSVGATQSKYRTAAAFNADGSFFIIGSEIGAALWRTDNFKRLLSSGTYTNATGKHFFTASDNGKLVCSIDDDFMDAEFKGIHIFLNSNKDGLPKEIHRIAFGSFFSNVQGYAVPANGIYFKGDSHHALALFQTQTQQAPFLLKTFQFKDSISVLGISPYQYTVKGSDGFDSTIDVSLDYAYSTKLHCYIICTGDTIYRINPAGKVIKKTSIQLKEPQLFYPLGFDPAAKYIFIQDADEKIHAVNIETGKSIYYLKSEDPFFTSISFSADNKRFILLNEDKTRVSVFDATTGNTLFSFKGHTPQLFNAVFSPDGKFILCCAQDGSYEKRDGATGKLIYSFFLFKNRDYAIISPEGYYYASSRSDVKYLNFRLNNKLYNFSQFDLQFNRPDKILAALGSTDTALLHAYYAAWLKRITKAGFAAADFSGTGLHVPDVDLQNKEALPAVTAERAIKIPLHLWDSLYKVTAYTIYINDVPVNGTNGTKLQQPSNSISLQPAITLDSGINKIEISCINEMGVESRKEIFYITCQPERLQLSKTWFIGIGINHYSQHGYLPNLSFCVKDIRDLAAACTTKYSNVETDTLLNDDATKENILALKKRLLQTGIDDRVIVSFNGHGMTFNDAFYFATPATNPQSPSEEGISYAEMQNLLDSIPARKKLLLIDACHSGEGDADEVNGGIITTGMTYKKDTAGGVPRGTGSVEIIDVKADDDKKTFNIFGMMKSAFIDLRRNNGAVVIAASQSYQQAQENSQYENGLFTSCLLDEMNAHRTLKVSELLKNISQNMLTKAKGQQPAGRQELSESDWVLW